jgi:hypothetical protein
VLLCRDIDEILRNEDLSISFNVLQMRALVRTSPSPIFASCQGVRAVEELQRAVAMSAVTPAPDDKLVHVSVAPAYGELHHMMQLHNRDLLGNQESLPTGGLTPRRLNRNWSMEVVSERSEYIDPLYTLPSPIFAGPDFSLSFGAVSQAMVCDNEKPAANSFSFVSTSS